MRKQPVEWEIVCDKNVFQRCQRDPKFPFIVALARVVNALNSSHSLITRKFKRATPETARNRMNSFFFSSALLYEGIRLIRKMNRVFADDPFFQNGLRRLLRDPVAQRVEQSHLKPGRNHAIFHFLPDKFEEAIQRGSHRSCVFISARGKESGDAHLLYADIVAAEMLIGIPSDKAEFLPAVRRSGKETGDLVVRFTEAAEELIIPRLRAWGFYSK
jgi:hypothetical protein